MSSAGMIDKVAMAMSGYYLDVLHPDDAEYWREKARAAIEAMREPTRDVLTAFVDDAVSVQDAAVRWACAIDAVLSTTHNPEEM